MAFEGFPKASLRFYRSIARHNDRTWFEAHRADYDRHVVAPAAAFIEQLGPQLQALRPGVGFDPNHTGRGSFKRIHTDQRFVKDRPPYKTYAQMIFWEGPLKTKKANSCFKVHFDPDRVVVGAGLTYFDGPAVLKAYRNAVIDPARGGALADVVGALRSAGCTLGREHYKRVPRGYDPEHAHADLLRHDALYASFATEPVPPEFHAPDLVDWCMAQFELMAALHAWCVDLLEAA